MRKSAHPLWRHRGQACGERWAKGHLGRTTGACGGFVAHGTGSAGPGVRHTSVKAGNRVQSGWFDNREFKGQGRGVSIRRPKPDRGRFDFCHCPMPMAH